MNSVCSMQAAAYGSCLPSTSVTDRANVVVPSRDMLSSLVVHHPLPDGTTDLPPPLAAEPR